MVIHMLHKIKSSTLLLSALVCVLITIAVVQTPPVRMIAAQNTEIEMSARELLKLTLDYCDNMDSLKYTKDTWNKFQKELSQTKLIYEDTDLEKKEYRKAREKLEKVKADLQFKDNQESSNPLPMKDLSQKKIVSEMGAGWNLGNTMEGHTGFTPNETAWQSVKTTKALIKSVHDMGFNTIRIPVTWGNMIDDENGYAINETWIGRVQDIVDYCISQDMYVIINLHHDGAEQTGWLRISADDIDTVYEKFEGVWTNIAERFKDYDEHLIFESMNEVAGEDDSEEGAVRDTLVIKNMNQIFVNVVRASGSNNSYRWLSVPGRLASMEYMTEKSYGFAMPNDTMEGRLFVSVHYADYSFQTGESLGVTSYQYDSAIKTAESLEKLNTIFSSQGVPVIMGEYDCINKDNSDERAYYVETFTRACRLNGIVACYWDQGWYDRTMTPDYSTTLIDRATGKTIDVKVTDAIMRGAYLNTEYSDIIKRPKVVQITRLTVSDEKLVLEIGAKKTITCELEPDNNNDVILWKTADETIATVYKGKVHARGIGMTTITGFSQSGSIAKVISVRVTAKISKIPCTILITGSNEYEVAKDKSLFLNVIMIPANTTDYITYKSSNVKIATVSATGKVVGVAAGTTFITMTASNGLTKTLKINVTGKNANTRISLALNVYYNDEILQYYNNEVGENILINEDGQYTLSFDAATDLSEEAIAAGVTGLSNLTAIYIKDYKVTIGKTTKTPLSSCSIMYDKIVVDGIELTINQKNPKSALKPSGIFDTNDPLNAIDGSAVDEVEVVNHILNMTTITNPQKIEVTFTISDLAYATNEVKVNVDAITLEAASKEEIILTEIGEIYELSTLIGPI
ncbi:MAG: cellulase family glycosylhydrolase, partial [Mobilitalea sp.]